MGFIEGFANAMSENIKSKRERKEKLDDDIFRANYQMYMSNLQDKRKKQEEESKTYGRAQFIANRHNLPDEAVKSVFQYLNGGGDEKNLEEMFKQGTMTFEPTQPKAPGNNSTMTANDQLAANGMTDPTDTDIEPITEGQSTDYVPKVEASRSPIATANLDPTEARQLASQENVVKMISDKTGEDQAKVRENLYGKSQQDLSPTMRWQFKPNSNQELAWIKDLPNNPKQLAVIREKYTAMGDFKKADQVGAILQGIQSDKNIPNTDGFMYYRDKDGKNIYVRGKTENGQFYRLTDKNEYEKFGLPVGATMAQPFSVNDNLDDKTINRIFKSVEPFEEKKVNAVSYLRDAQEAIDIVKSNPHATTLTAELVMKTQGVSNEIDALKTLAKTALANKDMSQLNSLAERSKGIFDGINMSGLDEGTRRLLRIQRNMVYANLKAMGETGSGISNKDIDAEMAAVFDPNPQRFASHLMSSSKSSVDKLESSRQGIINLSGNEIAQSRTHNYMFDSTQQQLVRMSGDDAQQMEMFLNNLKTIDPSNYRPDPQPTQPEQQQQSSQPQEQNYKLVGRTPDGREVYEDANGKRFTKE